MVDGEDVLAALRLVQLDRGVGPVDARLVGGGTLPVHDLRDPGQPGVAMMWGCSTNDVAQCL